MADRNSQPPSRLAKVILVEDHPIIRKALADEIDGTGEMTVCGEADTAKAALDLIQKTAPDIAIVGLVLKGRDGLELIKDISLRFPKLAVLVLSMREESIYANRAMRAGAQGYIAKEQSLANVIEAIRKLLAGQIYLNPDLSAKLLQTVLHSTYPGVGVKQLSDRELKVLEFIGSGLTTAEIAEQLHLSVKTVETYRERIKKKLDLANASELLKYAIEWGHEQGIPLSRSAPASPSRI